MLFKYSLGVSSLPFLRYLPKAGPLHLSLLKGPEHTLALLVPPHPTSVTYLEGMEWVWGCLWDKSGLEDRGLL